MIESLRNKRIGVLLGGTSDERDVSLRSGENVYQALIRLGYRAFKVDPAVDPILKSEMDIAFIVLHGKGGEDGVIQGYLQMRGIPYTGSRVLAAALTMDKAVTKKVLMCSDLPTLPFVTAKAGESRPALPFGYPIIIKPIDGGSSVGTQIFDSQMQFDQAFPSLFTHYSAFVIEPFVKGREITIGILELDGKPFALPILELRTKRRFYDYVAKYTEGQTEFILPAELDPDLEAKCKQAAVDAHIACNCMGMSRVDLMIDAENDPYILEINTIPGLTDLSDLPAQAKEAGISFDALVETILATAQ
ncbi:MAG: D-alanine--D-alanine ligase [Candidatus Margulisiibacteriota bacterium]